MNVTISQAKEVDLPDWLEMRNQLWPNHDKQEHLAEMRQMLLNLDVTPVFIARANGATPVGFLEGGTRPYSDGAVSSPVGYIEGWYVCEAHRKLGVGRALVACFEAWCREHGLSEVGSDTWIDNETSILAHNKLGYTVSERLVHFLKKL